MNDDTSLGVGGVASRLGVSPSTIRRWSTLYAAYLSPEASQPTFRSDAEPARRRYSEDDVKTLTQIRDWRAEGKPQEEILDLLQQKHLPATVPTSVSVMTEEQERVLSTSAAAVLAETLRTLQGNQQALLNSQQANRNLLGIVIQDNFNLKSENAKLRERLYSTEKELAELKETDWNHRLSLEERLTQLEQAVNKQNPLSRLLKRLW